MMTYNAEAHFDELAARTERLQEHVNRMAINHGLYLTLTDARAKDIPQPAKRAIDHLRNVCLMANLIGVCSLFSDRKPNDVGFNLFTKHIERAAFQSFITAKAESLKEEEPYKTIRREATCAQITEFLSGYECGVNHRSAIKPMRDKMIAHLSLEEFSLPTINNITEGTKISIKLTEAILFLFEGHDVQITNLIDDVRLNMTSLLRVDPIAKG